MTLSPLLLERSGWWRTVGLAAVGILALVPALPLLSVAPQASGRFLSHDSAGFLFLLAESMGLSVAGAGLALGIGLFVGVLHFLYSFRGAAFFRFVFIVPVMVPPLLWAVGLRNLSLYMMPGRAGVVFITVMVTLPLVILATISSCSVLNAGQCDAVRLGSGEWRLVRLSVRYAFPGALVAACLGACLMLSCPGPGLALGTKTAISEILVSFSALYDTPVAAMESIFLSVAVLLIALSAILSAGSRPAEILSGTGRKVAYRFHPVMSPVSFYSSLVCAVILVIMPVCGLLLPSFATPDLPVLMDTLSRTAFNTIMYATGSAGIATCLGVAAALFMGKSAWHRNVGACVMIIIFSLPAALTALGLLSLSASAPKWTDFLLRSPAAVCIAQGIRLFPLPALLVVRVVGSLPSSWSMAAELHGLSLGLFMIKVVIPQLIRPVVTGFMVAFLLSEADVGTVLLLHPPGMQNLPLAIFTIMANAPKALVAQLGLVYLFFAMLLLWIIDRIWRCGRRR